MDLRSCLENWPYDAENNVRTGHGADGREIILVRLPMGLEQYEMDGRPDGWRVCGMDPAPHLHPARSGATQTAASPATMAVTNGDCAALFHEAAAYLQRLNLLFRLNDWPRAERDSAQILRLLQFVKQHARGAEDDVQLELWLSHALRIHSVVRVRARLDKKPYQDASQAARSLPGISATMDDEPADRGTIEEALLENVRDALTDLLALQPREETCFLRQGDYWKIRHQGQTTFLKSMRGLHCLACLLRSPGREFHVSELLVRLLEIPAVSSVAIAGGGPLETGDRGITSGLNGGIPILDAQAKAEFKRRLNELRQELEEAEQFNDSSRAAELQEELNVIGQTLAAAIGLGGRDRKASSEAERARCAVTKRIKQAVKKIGDTMPALGDHLNATIKTGYFCSYNPHPDHPVHWKF